MDHKPYAAVDLLIPVVNVLVFVVIQTAFFWVVGSEEVLTVVRNKVRMLSNARYMFTPWLSISILRDSKHTGQEFNKRCLDTMVLSLESDKPMEEQIQQRKRENLRLIANFVGPFVIVSLSLLVLLTVLSFQSRKQHPFEVSHGIGMLLVFFGYLGEILLFLFVIDKYIMVTRPCMIDKWPVSGRFWAHKVCHGSGTTGCWILHVVMILDIFHQMGSSIDVPTRDKRRGWQTNKPLCPEEWQNSSNWTGILRWVLFAYR